MYLKILQTMSLIQNKLDNLEANLSKIDEKLDVSLAIIRNNLVRVKNGEELSDEMILLSRPYNDLTPERAFKIYNNRDLDFILLDVSISSFTPVQKLSSLIKIPLEELASRASEISSKNIPILVISEEGVRSITACEFLVRHGFHNVNNISGGYKFFPTDIEEQVPPEMPL